jgi:hypothetical protein
MEKRVRISRKTLIFLVTLTFVPVIIVIIASGCASTSSQRREKRSFNAAVKQDTAEAYSEFIEDNPEGAHIEDAKKRLIELEWEKTEKANTIEAYESFIAKYKRYPSDTDYIGLAQSRLGVLNDQLASNSAKRKKGAKKGEKASKFSVFKQTVSLKDGEARAKLVSLYRGERQRVCKVVLTSIANFFIRIWQMMYLFFQKVFAMLSNVGDVELDGGHIVRVEK